MDRTLMRGEKAFCCQGCLTVHDLLTESGLTQFYELNRHPGVRVGPAVDRAQWAHLDEPSVQQQLLDFAGDKFSRVTFHVPAIHCVACVWLLENLFRLHPGIGRSQVNFPRREVAVSFAPQKISLSELAALLTSIGYEPALTLNELEGRKPRSAYKRHWIQTGIAGFAFANIMLFSLPAYLGLDAFQGPVLSAAFRWLSLALALPVLVYSASDYWNSALLSLRQRTLTLDVPIALGLAALYAQSAFEIVSGRGDGYLDSLTGLVFFLLCGRAFQQKTHERLAFDRDYKSFFPLSVRRIGRAGNPPPRGINGAHGMARSTLEERVSLSQLAVGDRLLIRNHEIIPADSKLASESALIDYSFVTGESEPVAKQRGDYLYAGGKQMGAAIEVEMAKPVSDSYLTSLWNHDVFKKPGCTDFNTLTNRYSRWFTAAVVGVAAVAAMFWFVNADAARAIKAFTSVLIVACPCALALAAPFTLGTAQRILARAGIFMKNPLVLERMAKADTIVFDKTGTLTVADTTDVSFRGTPLNPLEKHWLASLSNHSTHPHSARIRESFRETVATPSVSAFRETAGAGLEGTVEGHSMLLGARTWLEEHGVLVGQTSSLSPPASDEGGNTLDVCPAAGSAVYLAIDGKFRGSFCLANTVRQETERLLRQLGSRYQLALLSGDNERERARFQSLFGDHAQLRFNQTPLDKLDFIHALQRSGKTVMMVGDGLNDAGALKQSDIGVAVIENVGAFSPASDVIMETSGISRLDDILALARRATSIVKLGLGISALYNVIGVSFAAAGLLSPLVAAVLMPLSSVSVVLFACGTATWTARRLRLARAYQSLMSSESERAERGSRVPAGSGDQRVETSDSTLATSLARLTRETGQKHATL